jgi:hypothetical protein
MFVGAQTPCSWGQALGPPLHAIVLMSFGELLLSECKSGPAITAEHCWRHWTLITKAPLARLPNSSRLAPGCPPRPNWVLLTFLTYHLRSCLIHSFSTGRALLFQIWKSANDNGSGGNPPAMRSSETLQPMNSVHYDGSSQSVIM